MTTQQKNESEHAVLDGVLWVLVVLALIYQGQIAYRVSTDFLSGGNTYLAYTFTAVIVAILAVVDIIAKRKIVDLLNMNRYSYMLFGVLTILMLGVFILEVSRINIQNNGGPLASMVAVEQEEALAPAVKVIDKQLQEYERIERYDTLKKLVMALKSAIEVEAAGGQRPDVEEMLNDEGIEFKFSGQRGRSKELIRLRSIRDQKVEELADFEKRIRAKYGNDIPDVVKGAKADMAAMGDYRQRQMEMKGMVLAPETYDKFMEKWRANNKLVAELVNKYKIDIVVKPPPQTSLFIIGIEGATELSWSAVTLWLIAFLTAFAGPLIILLVKAIIGAREAKAQITPLPRAAVVHPPEPRVARRPGSGSGESN